MAGVLEQEMVRYKPSIIAEDFLTGLWWADCENTLLPRCSSPEISIGLWWTQDWGSRQLEGCRAEFCH